jgi:hypothetical protein
LAGAVLNSIVVALARVYEVVIVPPTLTLMSAVSRYGKVKEKRTVAPSPVYVF